MEDFTGFDIEEWANTVGVLHNGDISSKSLVDGSELEADDTSTNDDH